VKDESEQEESNDEDSDGGDEAMKLPRKIRKTGEG
jgi:hypothetical protein